MSQPRKSRKGNDYLFFALSQKGLDENPLSFFPKTADPERKRGGFGRIIP
jgi:hypothetical protein